MRDRTESFDLAFDSSRALIDHRNNQAKNGLNQPSVDLTLTAGARNEAAILRENQPSYSAASPEPKDQNQLRQMQSPHTFVKKQVQGAAVAAVSPALEKNSNYEKTDFSGTPEMLHRSSPPRQ